MLAICFQGEQRRKAEQGSSNCHILISCRLMCHDCIGPLSPPLRPPRPRRPSVTPTRALNVNLGLCFGILVCPLDLLPACRGCVCEAAQRQATSYSLSFLSVVSPLSMSLSPFLSLFEAFFVLSNVFNYFYYFFTVSAFS